jgi:aspartyl-tRNA(Asn)/glutamyl-tRNA(Gln) amidotransferase subunit B
MGLPGTLPALNQKAIEFAAKAGLALGCKINGHSEFDRKNYFYPDLPKAYQISELYQPLCTGGGLKIKLSDGREKFVRINHIHLEEDAGKLSHDAFLDLSLADYNRCGVPLIEIVTEPDMSSAEEAANFVKRVSLFLRYAGVSDCRMEQGSLRADVNISLREETSPVLGTRAEIKNLNSTKSIMRAVEFEIKRQSEILQSGGRVVQETRGFNENTGKTKSLRSKEDAHDYRYFPDPDIPPVSLSGAKIEEIRGTLPVLPDARLEKYTKEYGLSEMDSRNLTENIAISDYFEECIKEFPNPKLVAACILVDIFRILKDAGENAGIPFPPAELVYLLKEREGGRITKADAKTVLIEMFAGGKTPRAIIKENGLGIEDDADAIVSVIRRVLAEQPKAFAQYKSGEKKVFGFLMGQCNRYLKGRASPQALKDALIKTLDG